MKDKILLVEDRQSVLVVLEDGLVRGGFDVSVASDGAEAVRMVESILPDLVLLDIRLPVLNGFEVLEELKRREVKTRVIMYSSHDNGVETAVRCIRGGACDFIAKYPIDIDETVDKIRKCLLLDTTMNFRVFGGPPVVEKLIGEIQGVEAKRKALESENSQLRGRVVKGELIAKTCSVLLSFLVVLGLYGFGIAENSLVLSVLFFLLVPVLLIPTSKIRSVAAQYKKFKARIDAG